MKSNNVVFLNAFLAFSAGSALAAAVDKHADTPTFNYEVVTGIFIQDDPATVPAEAGPLPPSFGLIDQSAWRWPVLQAKLATWNLFSGPEVEYKLLFLGRHGEGWHNVAEAYYGTAAWDETWSKLNGNGTHTWGPDAKITPRGISQAQNATALWQKELKAGIPVPQNLYSSPMSRSTETAKITFDWLWKTGKQGLIIENFREVLGVHTCDKRETKTYIVDHYGDILNIQEGFSEEDLLWQADYRETSGEMDVRLKSALDYVFARDGKYISITAHSGAINAIFRVIGHRTYSVPTGGVVPVVLKATRVA